MDHESRVQPGQNFRTCVIVPAFNEEGSVGRVVRDIQMSLPAAHIVVVDDGSTDGTPDEAKSAGAHVVSLPVNLGIGGAVQTGYRYASRAGFDLAIQIDGDGQHRANEVQTLVGPIVKGDADVVVGSRWLGKGDYSTSAYRRASMRFLAMLVSWRTGSTFTDTTSGFRACSSAAIALFAKQYPTDFPEVEAIVLAHRAGLRAIEVPVEMRYRDGGRSSIAGLRTAYYMLRVVVFLLVDRLNGRIV